jgi:site-specific DNA-methyltransferase (adenine-specific)
MTIELSAIAENAGDELQIHYASLSSLANCFLEKNSKKHDLDTLAESVNRYSFRDPIAFDSALNGGTGGIVEGNGRLEYLLSAKESGEAAPRGIRATGDDWFIPVVFGVNAGNENEAIAYSVSHNLSALWGSDLEFLDMARLFDEDLLKEQLTGLEMLPVGLDDSDLSLWLGTFDLKPLPEEDEDALNDLLDKVEDDQLESRVKLGEIWACGRHRVACGDSTDEETVRALLGDQAIDFVWSDPPYGISIVNKQGRVGSDQATNDRRRAKGGKVAPPKSVAVYAPVIGDETTNTAFASITLCEEIAPKAKKMYWGANHFGLLPSASCWIVWDKKNDGTSFADCELAWTNFDGAVRIFRHMWNGMLRDSENNGQKRCHPNQKPIVMAEWVFEKYGAANDFIFDPFLGSGISLLAAQKMEGDRTVFGFELSPIYCTVILERFSAFTGIEPELVGHLCPPAPQ